MKEEVLYFLWKTKNFNFNNLETVDGQKVSIIKFGIRNNYSGPDFLNGQVKINDLFWFGAIEFHVKTSDWELHNHQTDDAYNQVIVHVVWEHDKIVNSVPVLELKKYVLQETLDEIGLYINSQTDFPCKDKSNIVPRIYKEQLISSNLVERFESKLSQINKLLSDNLNDWEETSWQLLCTYFGFNFNSEATSVLAKKVKISWIHKIKHIPNAVEALIFGTAGFLVDDQREDSYYLKLVEEWKFFKNKYQIVPLNAVIWKKGGMRPFMQPEFKLAQLCAILLNNQNLFSKIVYTNDANNLKEYLSTKANPYWNNHFQFGNLNNNEHNTVLGKDSIDLLIINVAVPILYAYGTFNNNIVLKEQAFRLLESLPKETNKITKSLKEIIGFNRDASDSQAILNLYKNYCVPKKCLDCILGQKILS